MVSPLLLRAGVNHQRRHRWQAFLALAGIAMGVAIVLAVDLATHAAKAAFELSAAQLRGAATHRVIGVDGRVPTAFYRQLFTTPGMPAAAPVIRSRLRLAGGGSVQLVGLDIFAEGPFRAQLPGSIGAVQLRDWLTEPGLVVLSKAAAGDLGKVAGQVLQVEARGRTQRLKIAHVHAGDAAATRDLLLVDIATAQGLLDMHGHIGHVDLVADRAQADALRKLLPPALRLVDIDRQTTGTVGLSAAFELNLTAMSLLALVVGLFLIFNAMSFSVVQRRALFGRLRAVGALPGEIFRVVLAEALVLALVGSLVGMALGVLLGQGLTELVAATISELYYRVSGDALQLRPWSLAKGLLLGIGGTLIATLVPAWQAAASPPVSSLSRAGFEAQTLRWLPPLAIAGTAIALTGLALAFLVPGGLPSALLGLFAVILGLALVTPAAIPLFHGLLQLLPLRGIWRLAVRDLQRHVSRLGTAAAALMIALAAAVSVTVMVDSMRGAVSEWLLSALNADLYVAPADFARDATLPPGLADRIEALPGVTASSYYRHRRIELDRRPVALVGARLARQSRQGFVFTAGAHGAWPAFDRGAVLLSEPLANRLRLDVGDTLRLPSPAGPADVEIGGIFRDFASEHGRLFMPWPQYTAQWNDHSMTTLALFSADAEPRQLKHAAGALLAADPRLTLTEAGAIYRESMQVFERTFRITDVLRLLSLGVAFVGILSALMAIQLQRGKEFAVLRALGMTRRQLAGLVLAESTLIGGIAALLSLPTGLLMAWVLTGAVQFKAFGWTMPLTVDIAPQLLNLGVGVLAAVLAALYPAWRASRHDPAPQLRED